MASRVYVRDLEVLRNLDEGLSKFNHGTNSVLEQVARSIRTSQEHLRSRTNYWQAELRRREDALRACESARDDKGRGYDCRTEARAVRQAQESLEKLQKLSARLEQAIGEYTPYANRLQQILNAKVNKAKGDLHRSIQKYENYLTYQGGINLQPSVSGMKTQNKSEEMKSPKTSNDLFEEVVDELVEEILEEGVEHLLEKLYEKEGKAEETEFSTVAKGNQLEEAVIEVFTKDPETVLIYPGGGSYSFDPVFYHKGSGRILITECKNWDSYVYAKDETAINFNRLGANTNKLMETVANNPDLSQEIKDGVQDAVAKGRGIFLTIIGKHSRLGGDLIKSATREGNHFVFRIIPGNRNLFSP